MSFKLPLWQEERSKGSSDDEIRYVVTHGVRITGMSAFGLNHVDHDISNVRLIRMQNDLNDAQIRELKEAAESCRNQYSYGE